MRKPLVSCIVPCFNGALFLEECLQSIIRQTHRPKEIIVVDDGSTDDSATIVRRLGSDAVHYCGRQNGGPAAACNTGLSASTGPFIAFLEQDDVWEAGKLERQLQEFEKDEDLDYCVTYIQNFWAAERQHEATFYRRHSVMQPLPGYVVQTLLARRRAFDRVGYFDESLRFACATDWFIRAAEAGVKGVLIPDVLTHRRLHQNNFSRQNRQASREQFLHVIKAMLDRRRLVDQTKEANPRLHQTTNVSTS